MTDYRPRITAEITPAQMQILTRILPHGMKKPLFQVLVDGIISIHSKGGHEAIGAIISSYVSIEQVAALGLDYARKGKIEELEGLLARLKEASNGNNPSS